MCTKIDTNLSCGEVFLLPLFTPYSIRHLEKKGYANITIGLIELFPGISLLSTVIEYIALNCFQQKDPEVISMSSKNYSSSSPTPKAQTTKVAIVACKEIFMKHLTGPGDPESPQRVRVIEYALKQANLMDDGNTIKPRPATRDEISMCHHHSYQTVLEQQINAIPRPENDNLYYSHFRNDLWKVENVPGDFCISPDTFETSLYAAGAPLTAIEYILDKENKTSRAFCIVRPPGHHAHQYTGSGFCVFNNVAIAAKYLTQKLNFNRVLIVDWDAHHGDGTQTLVESDGKIFYFSTHMDTSGGFYPGPHWGNADDTGQIDENDPRTVLNCPVSGSKDKCREQILDAFRYKLIPAMEQYQPDFVLISCGFDAHEHDTLVGLGLKDEDYEEMTDICVEIAQKYANGRIVSVLEGGYNLEAISGAAKVHIQALGKSYISL